MGEPGVPNKMKRKPLLSKKGVEVQEFDGTFCAKILLFENRH